MDLRHAGALVAVVDSGGFRPAGEAPGLTQGAVSKHVAALESQTGLVLLRRTNRGAALTEPGRLFLPGGPRADPVARGRRDRSLPHLRARSRPGCVAPGVARGRGRPPW